MLTFAILAVILMACSAIFMAEQVNNPNCSMKCGGTIAAYQLVKINGANDSVVVTAASSDIPFGIAQQAGASTTPDVIAVRNPQAGPKCKVMVKADGTNIAIGDVLCAGASGKAVKYPGTTGTYYLIGQALEASTIDGGIITISPVLWGQKIVVP